MLIASNPFINAYLLSDWFGRGIFWGLFLLSAVSWSVLFYKIWQFVSVRRLSREFSLLFSEQREEPLQFQFARPPAGRVPHPFFEVYKSVKQHALQLMERNRRLGLQELSLNPADLDLIASQADASAMAHAKPLGAHLFILSTVVTLGPFLGLLGTVWGILVTFTEMPRGLSASGSSMLSGLSTALATTVIGLIVAIPALIGYNYLKNLERDYKGELAHFSQILLAAIEMQYRKG